MSGGVRGSGQQRGSMGGGEFTLYIFIHFKNFQVLNGKGNNLHEVEDSAGLATLCSMPPKFRKNVWIKRGLSIEGY